MSNETGNKIGLVVAWRLREKELRRQADIESRNARASNDVHGRCHHRAEAKRLYALADILGDAWVELADGLIEAHEPEARHAMRGVAFATHAEAESGTDNSHFTESAKGVVSVPGPPPATVQGLALTIAGLHDELASWNEESPRWAGGMGVRHHREQADHYRELADKHATEEVA